MKRAVFILCIVSFALCTGFTQGLKDSASVSLKKPGYGEGGGAGPAAPSDIQFSGGIADSAQATVQTLIGTVKVKGKGADRCAFLKTKKGTYALVLSESDAEAVFALKGRRLSVRGVFAGANSFILGAYEQQ